jgi:hypothetical protein
MADIALMLENGLAGDTRLFEHMYSIYELGMEIKRKSLRAIERGSLKPVEEGRVLKVYEAKIKGGNLDGDKLTIKYENGVLNNISVNLASNGRSKMDIHHRTDFAVSSFSVDSSFIQYNGGDNFGNGKDNLGDIVLYYNENPEDVTKDGVYKGKYHNRSKGISEKPLNIDKYHAYLEENYKTKSPMDQLRHRYQHDRVRKELGLPITGTSSLQVVPLEKVKEIKEPCI